MIEIGRGYGESVRDGGTVRRRWMRVEPGKELRVVVADRYPVWYRGHYVGGEMRPCLGRACVMCHDGRGVQERYVWSVADIDTGRRGLLEVGARVVIEMREQADNPSDMRGSMWTFWREGRSRHGALRAIRYEGSGPAWRYEIEPEDATEELRRMWMDRGWIAEDSRERGGEGRYRDRLVELMSRSA